MSQEEAIEGEAPPAKKKGKGRLVKAVVLLAMLGAGGGGAYAYVSGGLAEKGPGARNANVPQLVLKGEEDPYAPPAAEGDEAGATDIEGGGGSKYRTAYFLFTEEFTSNLKNSAGLIQVSIAAATHYDGRVLMWLKKHELALRSRVLVELADTPEEAVLTPEGKEDLQKRLAKGMNEVLTKEEGFGGVDAVYFRSLLIQ
jgi:flagellar FliL protein